MRYDYQRTFKYPGAVFLVFLVAIGVVVAAAVIVLQVENLTWTWLLVGAPLAGVLFASGWFMLVFFSQYEVDAQGITWKRRIGEEVRLIWIDLDEVQSTLSGGLRLTSRSGGSPLRVEALLGDFADFADVLRQARPDLWGTPEKNTFTANPLTWGAVLLVVVLFLVLAVQAYALDTLSAVFMLVFSAIFLFQLLIWPWRVSLDVDGMEIRSLIRRRRVLWKDIQGISLLLLRTGRSRSLVVRLQIEGTRTLDLRGLSSHPALLYNHLRAWWERQGGAGKIRP